jgi:CBS domain containing-hemolysin-like protein
VSAVWQILLPWLLPLLVFVGLSASLSASEAALVSLTAPDRRRLARMGRGGRAAMELLRKPDRLLATILLLNLTVNMMTFSVASIIGRQLGTKYGNSAEVATAFAVLAITILFSELIPKSLGSLRPLLIARTVAVPLRLAVHLSGYFLPPLEGINRLARNLISPNLSPEPELAVEDIERAIELGTGDAKLAQREQQLLQRAVRLGETRVDEWMRPRGHYATYDGPIQWAALKDHVTATGLVLLAEPEGEDVEGVIPIRLLRPNQLTDLRSAIEPVLVVPWSASVADALDRLRTADRQVAAVVNEYGDTIGIISQEEIMDGLVHGEPHRDGRRRGRGAMLEPVSADVWRTTGMMSTRRLAELLEVPEQEGKHVTVAGWIQESNRRLVRLGDTARWGDFELEVVQALRRGHWVIQVRRCEPNEDSESES